MLSARLLKSQSADSLLNSDMDTAPPQATPSNHTWLDGISQAAPKDMDGVSSAHSNQTHDAYLSLLTNKGIAAHARVGVREAGRSIEQQAGFTSTLAQVVSCGFKLKDKQKPLA